MDRPEPVKGITVDKRRTVIMSVILSIGKKRALEPRQQLVLQKIVGSHRQEQSAFEMSDVGNRRLVCMVDDF